MAIIVMSVGGSLLVPHSIDPVFLKSFQSLILQLRKKHKIVLVTGGGKTARDYIQVVQKFTSNKDFASLVGIETTKLHAALVASLFGKFHLVPDDLEDVKKDLQKDGLVVCGALGFQPKMTSDGDAALIAAYLHADFFVNLTNVAGLFDKDPHTSKQAKLIREISFADFLSLSKKIKYHAGQHFVLDQSAAEIISRNTISTYILDGKKLKNILACFSGKPYVGTLIHG